jgi:hypothetical protein
MPLFFYSKSKTFLVESFLSSHKSSHFPYPIILTKVSAGGILLFVKNVTLNNVTTTNTNRNLNPTGLWC